ncbi:hypothetical protein GCM10009775_36910 [Microbacterium aoyamense]|uniref:PepSY domain-containing protein n=1 Tax=Microbacterium aoyamense TaxID=344166 RepID=A0ABN2Q286_9MICO|nr:DUF3244 domain-containing protein [Microbacterium aoyamense]
MTDTQKPRSRKRTILISAGAAGAALVLIGGGVAIGAALADDRDDDFSPVAGVATASTSPSSVATQSPTLSAGSAFGATTTDELMAVIDAARAVAAGEAVSVDAERDGGWEVKLRSDTGAETEVRVSADGTAVVFETEQDDDRPPSAVLDRATVDAVVRAALGEADGRITDLDADSSSYDVTVVTADGRTIDIDLAGDFTVLRADVDD